MMSMVFGGCVAAGVGVFYTLRQRRAAADEFVDRSRAGLEKHLFTSEYAISKVFSERVATVLVTAAGTATAVGMFEWLS
ncbi:hypothetical protein [Prescottella subtropica]|uniref:hypothetical protein n=1 Tax=Prescottella subtropica TaxID=2545757 RepID=UPI0010F81983|nr:hypothetical protein [Prescottella subtropica]